MVDHCYPQVFRYSPCVAYYREWRVTACCEIGEIFVAMKVVINCGEQAFDSCARLHGVCCLSRLVVASNGVVTRHKGGKMDTFSVHRHEASCLPGVVVSIPIV